MAAHVRIVALNSQQKERLEGMLKKGRWTPRELTRARILLTANEQRKWSNTTIAKEVNSSRETVRSIRNRFLDEDLNSALLDRPRSSQPRKLTSKDEAICHCHCLLPENQEELIMNTNGMVQSTILLPSIQKRERDIYG